MLMRNANLRPIASPKRPNRIAPSGRTMNPAEKASSAKTRAVFSSASGKNSWPITGESTAKRLKSYQEKVVPSVEATITLRWAEVALPTVAPGPITAIAMVPGPRADPDHLTSGFRNSHRERCHGPKPLTGQADTLTCSALRSVQAPLWPAEPVFRSGAAQD